MSRFLFILFSLLLCTAGVQAQEITRHRLPEGRRCTVAAVEYQCFNLGEYVELLRIDSDLFSLTQVNELNVARIDALTHATDELELALESSRRSVTVLETERARLEALWQEENRLRHEAESRPSFDWIPWTLAGGFAIATLVLGLILGLQ